MLARPAVTGGGGKNFRERSSEISPAKEADTRTIRLKELVI